jgi:hypothetical protein
MAKHFRALKESFCVACKKEVSRGEMLVKIKDTSDSRLKRYMIEQCDGKRDAWIHRRCYRAIVATWAPPTKTT